MSICQYTRHATNQTYLHLLQAKVYYSPVLKTVQKLGLILFQLFHTLPQILDMYGKFSRCYLTKRRTMVRQRRLPHCKRLGNIFLGIEGFHLEEVVLACCGKYLAESGIGSIFVEQKLLVLKLLLRLW